MSGKKGEYPLYNDPDRLNLECFQKANDTWENDPSVAGSWIGISNGKVQYIGESKSEVLSVMRYNFPDDPFVVKKIGNVDPEVKK